jgi:hypothetical protein
VSKTNFVLSYERVIDGSGGSFYRGNIYREGDGIEDQLFNELPFNAMMTRFAKEVRSVDRVGVVMVRRLESPNHPGVTLSQAEVETIVKDPAAWIRSMSVPDRTVVIQDRQIATRSVLRVGHDTRAEAFGETVAVKYRMEDGDIEIECPLCGHWTPEIEAHGNVAIPVKCHQFDIEPILSFQVQGDWAFVSVEELLEVTQARRYWLPRAWNTFGSWISREDLADKITAFMKEKEHVQR